MIYEPPFFEKAMKAHVIDTRDRRVPVVFDGHEMEISANMAVISDIQEQLGGVDKALEDFDKVDMLAKILKIFFADAGLEMTEREILQRLYGDNVLVVQEMIMDAFRAGGYISEEPEEDDEEPFDTSMVPDDEEEKN